MFDCLIRKSPAVKPVFPKPQCLLVGAVRLWYIQ